MMIINKAYRILHDTELRRCYDIERRRGKFGDEADVSPNQAKPSTMDESTAETSWRRPKTDKQTSNRKDKEEWVWGLEDLFSPFFTDSASVSTDKKEREREKKQKTQRSSSEPQPAWKILYSHFGIDEQEDSCTKSRSSNQRKQGGGASKAVSGLEVSSHKADVIWCANTPMGL
jgi:DnaJ-class molecular chaperone